MNRDTEVAGGMFGDLVDIDCPRSLIADAGQVLIDLRWLQMQQNLNETLELYCRLLGEYLPLMPMQQ